jgi:hypothetical protein
VSGALKELWGDIWQINDEAVLALGDAGKLHTLRMQAQKGNKLPASDAEIDTLSIGSMNRGDGNMEASLASDRGTAYVLQWFETNRKI